MTAARIHLEVEAAVGHDHVGLQVTGRVGVPAGVARLHRGEVRTSKQPAASGLGTADSQAEVLNFELGWQSSKLSKDAGSIGETGN